MFIIHWIFILERKKIYNIKFVCPQWKCQKIEEKKTEKVTACHINFSFSLFKNYSIKGGNFFFFSMLLTLTPNTPAKFQNKKFSRAFIFKGNPKYKQKKVGIKKR